MRVATKFVRRLAVVPRWVIVPTIQSQSVAEHHYWVTLYAMEIADWLEITDSTSILSYAMLHDFGEALTGDFPSTLSASTTEIKQRFQRDAFNQCDIDWYKPTLFVESVVKLADCLEAWIFLAREKALGNKEIDKEMEHVRENLGRAFSTVENVYELDTENNNWGRFYGKFMMEWAE